MTPDDLHARRLVLVSGKGGVGKTVVSAAVAARAARSGKTVLLLSSDGRGDAAASFGRRDPGYVETRFEERLFGLTADFDALLTDFVETVAPVGFVADTILSSRTFRFFTRATPGLPDLLLLGKVRELFRREKPRRGEPVYDLVVVDAPATGHALSLVGFPRTLLRTMPPGPLRTLGRDLDDLLSDASRSALVVVAEPAELAAREAEELIAVAASKGGLATGLVVVNRVGRSGRPDAPVDLPPATPCVAVPELAAEDEPGVLHGVVDAFEGRLPARRRRPAAPSPLPDSLDLESVLDGSLAVLAGPGGVGKTTLSAALGLAAARRGRRVLVLTVDPARRLLQVLGLPGNADAPRPVTVYPLPKGGHLSVLQIDPKATFERLLSRVAPEDARRRIRENRLYAGLVDSLPGVLEYMGVEALHEHATAGRWDLVVLDTPPAARGLDFLDAPDRMVALLENDALKWFLRRDSLLNRALSGASRGAAAVLRLADRTLGFGFLSDLADFFHAFDGLYEGFRARSRAIREELSRASFLVVTSGDRTALATASDLASALRRRRAEPGLLVNRVAAGGSLRLSAALSDLPALGFAESPAELTELPARLADRMARR